MATSVLLQVPVADCIAYRCKTWHHLIVTFGSACRTFHAAAQRFARPRVDEALAYVQTHYIAERNRPEAVQPSAPLQWPPHVNIPYSANPVHLVVGAFYQFSAFPFDNHALRDDRYVTSLTSSPLTHALIRLCQRTQVQLSTVLHHWAPVHDANFFDWIAIASGRLGETSDVQVRHLLCLRTGSSYYGQQLCSFDRFLLDLPYKHFWSLPHWMPTMVTSEAQLQYFMPERQEFAQWWPLKLAPDQAAIEARMERIAVETGCGNLQVNRQRAVRELLDATE